MDKRLVVSAGGTLVLAGIVTAFLMSRDTPGDPPGDPGLASGADSDELALDQLLKVAEPSESQLQQEIALLGAQPDEADQRTDPEEDRPGDAVPEFFEATPPAPSPERDYDLADLEEKLVSTLQLTALGERQSGLRDIAMFLAQTDQDMASRFLQAILSTRDRSTGGDANAFATQFVEELARIDPGAAARWTEALPDYLKPQTQQLVVKNWVRESPAELEKWIRSLDDAGLRAGAIRIMSNYLDESDPDGFALGWSKRLAENEQDGPRLSEVVVNHWGKDDFEAAYSWALGLGNYDDIESGILALAKSRSEVDAPGTAAWARDNLEGALRSQAIHSGILEWLKSDPAAVASWVDELGDPEISDSAFDLIAIAWIRKDEGAALNWMATADVSDQRKEYAVVTGRQ